MFNKSLLSQGSLLGNLLKLSLNPMKVTATRLPFTPLDG
jgi:hypothetical protein